MCTRGNTARSHLIHARWEKPAGYPCLDPGIGRVPGSPDRGGEMMPLGLRVLTSRQRVWYSGRLTQLLRAHCLDL